VENIIFSIACECTISAQQTFIIIINVENGYAAKFFGWRPRKERLKGQVQARDRKYHSLNIKTTVINGNHSPWKK